MADRPHIGLDNPAFRGRLRPMNRTATSFRAASMAPPNPRPYVATVPVARPQAIVPTPVQQRRIVTSSVTTAQVAIPVTVQRTAPQPIRPQARTLAPTPTTPLQAQTQREIVATNALTPTSEHSLANRSKQWNPRNVVKALKSYSKLQYTLVGMAVIIFVAGIFVSLSTLKTNQTNTKKIAAIAHAATKPGAAPAVAPPATDPPSPTVVSSYTVGPNMPRYLDIPKLSVHARVKSLGILSSGALSTPSNVFDVGWYNGSSLPGQPGAVLMDGHVSSWTTHGVFYGIKNLSAGDAIQITRGDGTVFSYHVVRTQTYDSDSVDMAAAMNPVTLGKPGLNLITCTGKVKPGTSEFNERVIVFAEQI